MSTVDEVFLKLVRYKNGVVADAMRKGGIVYERNFGVSIIDIRRIAKEYFPNHTLACNLFLRRERECKLAAAYIDNCNEVTEMQICTWAQLFTNVEVTEIVCKNLFGKTRFASAKINEWICSENIFLRQAAWNMLAVANVKSNNFYKNICTYNYNSSNVQNAAIQTLVHLAQHNLKEISIAVGFMLKSENTSTAFVAKEVSAFLAKD